MTDPILDAALELLGHPYTRGASLELRQVDCTVFARAILERVYPATRWTSAQRRDLVVADAARPWSAMSALEAVGLGRQVAAPGVGRWHLCQGWIGLSQGRAVATSRGHCWLWLGGADGRILEATPMRRPWWRTTTWEDQRRMYHEVRVVELVSP
jgi:hypothetical protein